MQHSIGNPLEAIQDIGLKEYIQCVIVLNKLREAYLFQTVEFGEFDDQCAVSREKLSAMKYYFPTLTYTKCDIGTLISLEQYPIDYIHENIWKLLNFPCDLKKEKQYQQYICDIKVSCHDKSNFHLINFICYENDHIVQGLTFSQKLNEILTHDFILVKFIKTITFHSETHFCEMYYVNLLSSGNPLNEFDKLAICNFLYNILCYTEELEFCMKNYFQYNNPIHRGILISLLVYSNNPPISPFYPLQNSKHHKEIEKQCYCWTQNIITSIQRTEIH